MFVAMEERRVEFHGEQGIILGWVSDLTLRAVLEHEDGTVHLIESDAFRFIDREWEE